MNTAPDAYKIALLRKLRETLQNMPPDMSEDGYFQSPSETMFVPGRDGQLKEIQHVSVLGSPQNDHEAGLQIRYFAEVKIPDNFSPEDDLRPLNILLLRIAEKSGLKIVPQLKGEPPVQIDKKGTCVPVDFHGEHNGQLTGMFCISFHKDDIPILLQTVNSMLADLGQSFTKKATDRGEQEL